MFKKYYFQLQLILLMVFKSTILFDKINQLEWYKRTLREWVDDLNLQPKNTVLEVGCATGAITSYIKKIGATPIGADYSKEMIIYAKNKNVGISFFEADVMNLPFDTNYFDAVIATSLINIVDNQTQAMSELARTCKQGGKVSILVPLKEFTDEQMQLLQASVSAKDFSAAAMNAWHKNPPKMNANEIKILFEEAGLTDVSTKVYLEGMVISGTAIKPF